MTTKKIRHRAGRGSSRIARITDAEIHHYTDTGGKQAHVYWEDQRGHLGHTAGEIGGAHVEALLERARREGVRVKRTKY